MVTIVGDVTGKGGHHWWLYAHGREIAKGTEKTYEAATEAALKATNPGRGNS